MSRYTRDFLDLLDCCTYQDDYGVHGSDFTVCRICDCESGAGVLSKPNWHASDCPVPRLQKKYSGKGQRGPHERHD